MYHKCQTRCCENCTRFCCGEFKHIVNLKNSGLMIYVHEDESKQRKIRGDRGRSIILYNTGNRELKRFDFIVELCRYRTKCVRCTSLIQSVRSLLDDINTISKDQILGVCEYCKRSNMRNKCKRCEYFVDKFIKNRVQEYKDREDQFLNWLYKVQRVLLSIMQGRVICKHNVWLDSDSKMQLDKLLQNLIAPTPVKQPIISVHPAMLCLENTGNDIINSKQILDELVLKMKDDDNVQEASLSDSTSESDSTCICKYLKNERAKSASSPIIETFSKEELGPQLISKESSEKKIIDAGVKNKLGKLPFIKEKSRKVSEKQNIELTEEDRKKENVPSHNLKKNRESKTVGTIERKGKKRDSYEIMLKMMKEREKDKRKEKLEKHQDIKKIPVIPELPVIKTKKRTKVYKEESESIIECVDLHKDEANDMIKGTAIIPYDFHYKDEHTINKPLLFQIQVDCAIPSGNTSHVEEPDLKEKHRKLKRGSYPDNSGIILYQLSNREFVDKGWTMLPTTKIMRRMNIYKMIPSHYEFDWFHAHKEQNILFYDSGMKLAEVFENGCGKWFYENGDIALDYYNAADALSGRRYIIYSSSDDTILNKKNPITILACFDYLGNGIVYDCCGNVRLKFNQSEGLIMDKKIGPPGRWKWHTLNDPPVLQQVFLNTHVKKDPCFEELPKMSDHSNFKHPNEDMIAIELENFVREKATKMLQKFRPFEVRIKVLKINNNFSLRIMNQSNIYLIYRCGRICLKQNIGMLLKSDEIIDTDISELNDVSTPYDCRLPKSESLHAIQNILMETKKRTNLIAE